ncbi:calmodulin-like protein containing EF hand domain [Diplonema papillatum]|nr:calmodulin-like protein containing EF hand domain [Diplonema papillatum]
MFLIACATDLFGKKENIKLEFTARPTLVQLINAVESQFDVLSRSVRPPECEDLPFRVETFQCYHDILRRWVDVKSATQLVSGCQIFCFQPKSAVHSDVQGSIPTAKNEITWVTPTNSPQRVRITSDRGEPPKLEEKLRRVFYDIDKDQKRYLQVSDFRAALAYADIEFTFATVDEMFRAADTSGSGQVTLSEWITFAQKYPSIVDALYFRCRDAERIGRSFGTPVRVPQRPDSALNNGGSASDPPTLRGGLPTPKTSSSGPPIRTVHEPPPPSAGTPVRGTGTEPAPFSPARGSPRDSIRGAVPQDQQSIASSKSDARSRAESEYEEARKLAEAAQQKEREAYAKLQQISSSSKNTRTTAC